MRDTIYKFLPIVFGTVLGWMLWNPPAWLSSLGWMAWLVNLGIVALLFVSSVPLIILANLPEATKLQGLGQIPPEFQGAVQELGELGFRPAGPGYKVNVAPSATLVGFVHESQPIYATVFRTGTVPAKTGQDFVSILHGDHAGLTTNADPGGAALPGGPGALRQVLPGAGFGELYQAHLDGLSYLRTHGLSARGVAAERFHHDFAEAMNRQRRTFLASPVANSLVTVWRATTKHVPCTGKLAQQASAPQQIQAILGSVSGN